MILKDLDLQQRTFLNKPVNVVNQVSDGVKGSTGVDLSKMLKDFVSNDSEEDTLTDNESEENNTDFREF